MFLDPTEAKLYLDTMIERSERGGHNKRDNGVDKVVYRYIVLVWILPIVC